jgi:hypothetical protein
MSTGQTNIMVLESMNFGFRVAKPTTISETGESSVEKSIHLAVSGEFWV